MENETAPIVMDTSALLAWFLREPGREIVRQAMKRPVAMSAANWAEIARKSRDKGLDWPKVRLRLLATRIAIEPLTLADAEASAFVGAPRDGLSLADRLCIALGHRLGAEILTADQAWRGLPGVTIIR